MPDLTLSAAMDSFLSEADPLTNKTLTNPTIINYTEGVVAIGNSGTAKTITLSAGTFQTVTLTGNCTFTMPNPTAGKSFTIKVMTGNGGFTASFMHAAEAGFGSFGVKWSGNAAPVVTADEGRYDLFSFIADGSFWSGAVIQDFSNANPRI